MTVQRSHGRAYPLVSPPDELPAGQPGPARQAPTGNRGPDGRLLPGNATRELAGAAGRAAGEARRLERLLGRVELPEEHPLYHYRRDACDWRNAHLVDLAASVGGGEVGPAVQAIVSSAALQHAASRWLFDRGAVELDADLVAQASRLADASRQNLLAAHELAAKAAASRPRPSFDPLGLRAKEPSK